MARFIDLFSGLGGFHVALKNLGHQCVLASEINVELRKLYNRNFGQKAMGDIREIDIHSMPPFDILCGGFPCQPFSKAGKQDGINDLIRGTLFFEVAKILEVHRPEYIILENVPHLARHDNKRTWALMEEKLRELNYDVDLRIYSPHEFGIPQHRKRVYIVAKYGGNSLSKFDWIDKYRTNEKTSIKSILGNYSLDLNISSSQLKCLNVWQEFLNRIDKDERIGFPIWSFEFGATYPYKRVTPHSCKNLNNYLGSYGYSLYNEDHTSKYLPSYARVEQSVFPSWKQNYIELNRNLYDKYQNTLGDLIESIIDLEIPSWQKFEWNCQNESRSLWDKIIQFRASGVRVKKADYSPSLVCTPTQIPIIGSHKRYLSKREGLRLQSFPEDFHLLSSNNLSFKALGNAVNVKIIEYIVTELVGVVSPHLQNYVENDQSIAYVD